LQHSDLLPTQGASARPEKGRPAKWFSCSGARLDTRSKTVASHFRSSGARDVPRSITESACEFFENGSASGRKRKAAESAFAQVAALRVTNRDL
jgi:hypothetical protein